MREYEIVYIFRSSLPQEEIDGKLARYHSIITGADGGEVTALEPWGKRQLAYPIRRETNAYYVVAQFTADPAVIGELERTLKLEEDLLRYLIVLSEGELPIPRSLRDDREEDEEEDDDEEEDEDRDRRRRGRSAASSGAGSPADGDGAGEED